MNVHPCARTVPFSRALLVRRHLEHGWSLADAAVAAGVSARTAYKWLARFRAEGEAGLVDRSCRPSRSPRATSASVADQVVALRRLKWTGLRISRQLSVAQSTVSRLLRKEGVSRARDLEPRPDVVRYERERPGELVHIDIKKLNRFDRPGHRVHGDRRTECRGVGWDFVHVCVDDHSRRQDPPPLHETLQAPNQRQGRAIHPVFATGVGLRCHLHQLGRTQRRPPGVGPKLQ